MTAHYPGLLQSLQLKIGGVKLVLLSPPSEKNDAALQVPPNVSKMSTLTYNQENSVITKNTIILNIIHNIFNLRDTEVVVCILIILLKKADDLNNI